MQVIQIDITKEKLVSKARVACIGFFESLHCAHQKLLEACFKYKGCKSFITFHFDEKVQINKNTDTYLMNRNQKIEFVQSFGFDEYIEINFNSDTQQLTHQEFERVLHEMGVTTLICGFDFQYGQNRIGNVSTLQQSRYFNVVVINEMTTETTKISSTLIKMYLDKGEVEAVCKLLNRGYAIRSVVVEGKKLGRKIGFPTANLENKLSYHVPKIGVYYGQVVIDKVQYPAMISVGLNPTVETLVKPVIEANILDFNQDIYGKEVDVVFLKRLRDEIKFDSLDALIQQLHQDEKTVRGLLCD